MGYNGGMNNKALVLIALVLIVILGYAWVNDKTNAPTQDQSSTLLATTTNANSNSSTTKQVAPATKATSQKTTPIITSSGVYLVYYTNKGFSPNPLKIPKSKSVRFVNASDKAMRIFSGLDQNDNRGIVNQSKTV